MRTITAYGIAVIIVFAILNGIFWLVGNPRLHDLNVFSAGFVLGMLGMYIAAWRMDITRWLFIDAGHDDVQMFTPNVTPSPSEPHRE